MPRSPTAIGLDIGGRTLQLVALQAEKGGPRLLAALTRELPLNQQLTREELAGAVRELRQAARVTGPVSLAIGGNVATVQLLSFPKTSDGQLRRMVGIEAQRLAGLSPEEMVHDFIALPNSDAPDQKVLLGLCRASAIHEQLAIVTEAGAETEDVTLSTIALFNAFLWNHTPSSDEATAYLEIGRDATNLAIETQGILQFVRSFPTGGNAFTAAVAESEQLDFMEAERWKTEEGEVPASERADGRSARRQAALYHAAETWLKELNTNLTYFFSGRSTAVKQIDRYILCGGGAPLKGFASFLETNLRKPVLIGEPLRSFGPVPELPTPVGGVTEADPSDPRFAIALGLALQGLGEAPEVLSLLPETVRAARISPLEGKQWLQVGLLGMGVSLLVMLWAISDNLLQGSRLADHQKRAETARDLGAKIEAEKNKRLLGEQMIAPILNTANRREIYLETFRALAESITPDDFLTLVVDAESYYSPAGNNKVPEITGRTSVARTPAKSAASALSLGPMVDPMTQMVVEGYALRPDHRSETELLQRLRARLVKGKNYFKHVDSMPTDLRVSDNKEAQWEPYHMSRFTLTLDLTGEN